MKQAKYILLSFAALAGLAACSSDSDFAPSRSESGSPVVVKAAVGKGSIFTRTNPAGTADEQAEFNHGDTISLSDGQKAVKYILGTDGTTWNPATAGEYLTWHSASVDFKAYYPTIVPRPSSMDPNRVKVNSYNLGYVAYDQSTKEALAASDYMTATKTDSKETGDHTLNLEFERKTARIVVNILGYNNQFDGLNPHIAGITINGKVVTDGSEGGNITPYEVTPQKQYVALVCPAEGNKDAFIQMSIGHDDDGFAQSRNHDPIKTNLVSSGYPKFEAGKSYTFNLTVGKDKLTVESVTVDDWAQGAVIPGGEAEINKISEATAKDLGKVVTSNGNIYSTAAGAKAAGETAVAMIAYVGDDTGDDTYNHGLAIALTSAKSDDDAVQSSVSKLWSCLVSGANGALTNYINSEKTPQYSGGWRLPNTKDLKHIFASMGGTEYTDGMPTDDKQECNPGDFVTKMTACGGDDFPPLSTYDRNSSGYIYTTDMLPGHDGYYWLFDIKSFQWRGGNTYTYVSVRPVFAF